MSKTEFRHYSPGLDAKQAYQKNLLIGVLASIGLAILCAVGVRLCEGPTATTGQDVDQHAIVPRRIAVTKSSPSRAGWLLPAGAPRSGFLGFISRAHISELDASSPNASRSAWGSVRRDIAPDMAEGAGGIGDQWSAVGDGSGTDDFGLPPAPISVQFVSATFVSREMTPQFHDGRLKPDQPAQIKFNSQVCWPRKGKNVDRGRAVVQLYVDCRGNIDSCVTVEDLPRNCDFATALKAAIFDSWIHPAIIGGREVASNIKITYDFVTDRSGRPVASAVQSSGNVSVRYPGAR